MKNITTKSIILFFILCFSAQLSILAQKNPPKTIFTMKNAWWTNIIDNDKDGYTQNRKLHFDVDVNMGTQSVYAEIFYMQKTGKYKLYISTPAFTINGKNNADEVAITIGYPNTQLAYNYNYDFEIKIIPLQGNSIGLKWSAYDDWDLKNQKFETFNQDLDNYMKNFIKIVNVGLDDTYAKDIDGDGYPSYRRLDFRLYSKNVSLSQSIYAKLFYKKSSTSGLIDTKYHLSDKTNTFFLQSKVNGKYFDLSLNMINTTVVSGVMGLQFARGKFKFKVEIYNSKSNNLIGYLDQADYNNLSELKMENIYLDRAGYMVPNIWWNKIVDNDKDGYTKFRKLYFLVRALDSGDHKIYAKLYYKKNNTGNYSLYHVTPPFKTFAFYNMSYAYWIAIGAPHKELPRNIYDFKIDIYDNYSHKLITSVDSKNDQNLNDIKFEKNIEEAISIAPDAKNILDKNIIKVIPKENFNKLKVIPLQTKYIISDTWWTDAKDRDSDGYTRYRRLHFNVDVESGTNKVYAKIYYKTSSANFYSLYYTTTPFPVVAGNTKSDNYWIAVGKPHTQPPHNIYDFKIEIYEPGNNKWFVKMLPAADSDLANNKFEKFSEDPFPN